MTCSALVSGAEAVPHGIAIDRFVGNVGVMLTLQEVGLIWIE